MDLLANVFDPLHEGAMMVRCRWAATNQARARVCDSYVDGRRDGYILTLGGSRVALAPRSGIRTKVA
jgi:hypothetical protein